MKKQYSAKRIISFLFGLWKVSPWLVWLMILSQVAATVLTMTIAPIFVSQLLSDIANGKANISQSIWLLVAYAITFIIAEIILKRISLALAYITESKMQVKVEKDIMKHLMSKSIGFHSDRMSGGVVNDANNLVGAIESAWDNLIFNIVPIFTIVTSVCFVLIFVYWQYAVTLFVLFMTITIVVIRVQTSISHLSKNTAKKSSINRAYLADVVGNIPAVKAFARESYEATSYERYVEDWRNTELKEMHGVTYVTAIFSTLMVFMNTAAFVAAILATQYHIANISAIYLVFTYTLNVAAQLWDIADSTRSYIRMLGNAGPMIETLDSEIEIKDPQTPKKSIIHDGKIEFVNVSFTHDNNNDALFHDFSLSINPGERIGLVGSSGSGKTSLTRLLLRFSDIDSGAILIDNQDIREITQDDLHKCIAFVPQEPSLFHRSLKENIAYGKPDATDEEVRDAAKQANALDFIDTLKDGFNTLVGERGIKLSGGQRQRIAIARAILKDAPILVLDEATSALDSETEALIQQALKKLMKGRTSIVIAHRLSTISSLDRIVVMEDGKIVEQGTHDELLELNGVYCKLWLRQSGGFIKE